MASKRQESYLSKYGSQYARSKSKENACLANTIDQINYDRHHAYVEAPMSGTALSSRRFMQLHDVQLLETERSNSAEIKMSRSCAKPAGEYGYQGSRWRGAPNRSLSPFRRTGQTSPLRSQGNEAYSPVNNRSNGNIEYDNARRLVADFGLNRSTIVTTSPQDPSDIIGSHLDPKLTQLSPSFLEQHAETQIRHEQNNRARTEAENQENEDSKIRVNKAKDRVVNLYKSEIEMYRRLNRNFESVQIQIEQVARAKLQLESKIEMRKNDFEATIANQDKIIEEMRQEVEDLQAKNEQKQDENKQIQEKLDDTKRQIETSNEEIAQLEKSSTETQLLNSNLKIDHESLKSQIQEQQLLRKKQSSGMYDLNSTAQLREQEVYALTSRNELLQNESDMLIERSTLLEQEVAQLDNQISEASDGFTASQSEIVKTKSLLHQHNNDVSSTQSLIKKHKIEQKKLLETKAVEYEAGHSLLHDLNSQQSRFFNLEFEERIMNTDIQRIEYSRDKEAEINSNLQSEVDKLKDGLQLLEKQKSKLKFEFDAAALADQAHVQKENARRPDQKLGATFSASTFNPMLHSNRAPLRSISPTARHQIQRQNN